MTVAPTCAPIPTRAATASPPPHRPIPVPALRLLPVPACAPPYDDAEKGDNAHEGVPHGAETAVQGTLALAFSLPGGLPADPDPSPALRVVPTADEGAADEGAGDDGAGEDEELRPRPTPRAALPDPRLWAARLAQALTEVVAGERPNAQLVRWTSPDVHDQLDRRIRRLASAGAPGVRRAPRWVVRSIHVSEPTDGVAEACALVAGARRHAALALRLEGIDGRWCCTALELGW